MRELVYDVLRGKWFQIIRGSSLDISSNVIDLDSISNSSGFYDELLNEYHWIFTNKADDGSGLQFGITVQDGNGNNYLYGFTDDGYMYRLEHGTTFDGTPIISEIETGDMALNKGSILWQTSISELKTVMKAKTNTPNKVQVTFYGDTSTTGKTLTNQPAPPSPVASGKQVADVTIRPNFGTYIYHRLRLRMTTDNETIGFEPIFLGLWYKIVRQDRGGVSGG